MTEEAIRRMLPTEIDLSAVKSDIGMVGSVSLLNFMNVLETHTPAQHISVIYQLTYSEFVNFSYCEGLTDGNSIESTQKVSKISKMLAVENSCTLSELNIAISSVFVIFWDLLYWLTKKNLNGIVCHLKTFLSLSLGVKDIFTMKFYLYMFYNNQISIPKVTIIVTILKLL